MNLMILDKDSFQIIRRWNLDNLEYVLSTVSNELIKQHPFWYYLVPYDGLLEVLASMVNAGDPVDVGLKLIEIESSPNPLKEYSKFITEARSIQKDGENIISTRYARWCLAEQDLSQSLYKIVPTAELKEEFFSNPKSLKNIYGDQWKKYYCKRVVA